MEPKKSILSPPSKHALDGTLSWHEKGPSLLVWREPTLPCRLHVPYLNPMQPSMAELAY